MDSGAASKLRSLVGPAYDQVAVTPSDVTNLPSITRGLYVGVAGNVAVVPASGGAAVTFVAVPAGTVLPIQVSRVNSTNTTASSIVALF